MPPMPPVAMVDADHHLHDKYHENTRDDGESYSDDDDSTHFGNSAKNAASEPDINAFHSAETKQVCCARTCLIFVLILCTVLVSFTLYYTLRTSEDEAFETGWAGDSTLALRSFQLDVESKMRTATDFSYALTSSANIMNMTWPYVTLDSIVYRGNAIRSQSHSLHLAVSPFVTADQRTTWEQYTIDNIGWIDGIDGKQNTDLLTGQNRRRRYLAGPRNEEEGQDNNNSDQNTNLTDVYGYKTTINEEIFDIAVNDGEPHRVPAKGDGPFLPMWLNSPVIGEWINYNLYSGGSAHGIIDTILETQEAVISRFNRGSGTDEYLISHFEQHQTESYVAEFERFRGNPIAMLYYPVFKELSIQKEGREVVAIVTMLMYWEAALINLNVPGIMVVMHNECRGPESFLIEGDTAVYLGEGDLHDPKFEEFRATSIVAGSDQAAHEKVYVGVTLNDDYCPYSIYLYPTEEYYAYYHSSLPAILAGMAVFVFFFTAALLTFYDSLVERRKAEVMETYKMQEGIVAELFPAHIREKMYNDEGDDDDGAPKFQDNGLGIDQFRIGTPLVPGSQELGGPSELMNNSGLDLGDDVGRKMSQSMERPIAELFRETTVLFLIVDGFDAWSSMRDPGELFTLLQTLFQCFDGLAHKFGVFKVETVGESYVAVTGLPSPQDDHAVRMARFARECLHRFIELTRELEVELGPDTGELQVKIGLHSGSVTAGVLKGDKSRFQLFGDTMNTSSRMMSTGLPNRIQCSLTTADNLRFAAKEKWLQDRAEMITAKGKGQIQTYWILPRAKTDMDDDDGYVDENMEYSGAVVDITAQIFQKQRLIDWHVHLLCQHLKRIAWRRQQTAKKNTFARKKQAVEFKFKEGSSAVEEVTEIIQLPEGEQTPVLTSKRGIESIELSQEVVMQLRDYVTTIASMYRDNAFHNFEHATHVTMSTNKLLKRVVQPIEEDKHADKASFNSGLASNPVTQFAMIFCALIHDVDHMGVSNFQLVNEGAPIARLYKHRSVAEQNSIDISWDLLMDPVYEDFRNAIYETESELQHFRQIVVNIVMATDIFDAQMKAIRNNRWDKAFQNMHVQEEVAEMKSAYDKRETVKKRPDSGVELKATIVMEHLIQASDVSHTMQHFNVYLKWNERLFQEMYRAYEEGRADKDPSQLWYEGEIMFFDKYIIPLAAKLAECGVFGVSSDEYLDYACHNRSLWAAKGDELVEQFKKNYAMKYKRRRSSITPGVVP